jgi:hypothetical protein
MNQTQKRLKIINLAISITDIDTIQLQILKLNQIKTDIALQEIITTLHANNYAKAQSLIQEYLDNPPREEVIQRVDNVEIDAPTNLYEEIPQDETPIEIKLDDMLKIQQDSYEQTIQESISQKKEEIDFDSLLSISQEDVLKDNIDIDISSNNSSVDSSETLEFVTGDIPKDTYLDNNQNISQKSQINNTKEKSNNFNGKYSAIPHIEEKFQNILKQYPQTQPKITLFESTQRWLEKIKNEGYSEENIEEIIEYIKQISKKNKSEASQLLLLTACCDSNYATFILARELYRGNLIEQDINQSFDLMYQLAINESYPEAICDLAQFYEYGIGVKADKKQALKLYDEAMQLGITRAMRHYDRLSKQKKKLFSLF